ncbi:MAG: hypothetical protein IJT50_13810 [Lentisphaeria bacterium]|nr:hypothetical protein [Lentisphaeria bacterium]
MMSSASRNAYLSHLILCGDFQEFEHMRASVSPQSPNIKFTKCKEFRFGALIGESGMRKAKAHTKEDVEICDSSVAGSIPFVSRTEPNNSVDFFVKNEGLEGVEDRNAIVVGDTTATVSYQAQKFIAGDHIVVIRAPWINVWSGLFIVTMLKHERFRYSYGRAFTVDFIKNTMLRLPAEPDGAPDWACMEKFMKSLPFGNSVRKDLH